MKQRPTNRRGGGGGGGGEYEMVSLGEHAPPPVEPMEEKIPRILRERVFPYLMSCLFVAVGWLVAEKAKLVDVVKHDVMLDRFYLHIALGLLAVDVCIGVWLVLWLRFRHGAQLDDWQKHSPNSIPVATVVGMFCAVCFLWAFWPVYHWWTPVVLGLVGWGVLHLFEVVPGPWWL